MIKTMFLPFVVSTGSSGKSFFKTCGFEFLTNDCLHFSEFWELDTT